MELQQLREAVEKVELVDGHAHNIVALDSTFPFAKCLTEAEGEALSFAPHSLSYRVSVLSILSCALLSLSLFIFASFWWRSLSF